jgi:DNA-directed RNA polymerase subunit RPC12/RpoP
MKIYVERAKGHCKCQHCGSKIPAGEKRVAVLASSAYRVYLCLECGKIMVNAVKAIEADIDAAIKELNCLDCKAIDCSARQLRIDCCIRPSRFIRK